MLWQSQFLVILCVLRTTLSVIPTGQIKIYGRSDYLYGAPGSFSSSLPSYTSYGRLLEPTNAADGCEPIITKLAKSVQYYLLVSRGVCSFQDKQSAAYYAGAKGVIVYNTLEGIYQGQNYSQEVDYDCDNGSGFVNNVIYPVYSDAMDASMPPECTKNSKCDSGKCVVTNVTDPVLGTKVCCAWDLYLTMGSDSDAGDPVDLPAVFIRMADKAYLDDLPDQNVEIQLYQRPLYWEFVSILLLYSMAVGTLTYGAFRVAMTDRKEFNDQEIEQLHRKKKASASRANHGATSNYTDASDNERLQGRSSGYQQGGDGSVSESGNESDFDQFSQSNPLLNAMNRKASGRIEDEESGGGGSSPKHKRSSSVSSGVSGISTSTRDDDTVELHSGHAIAFVVCSSLFLILLYSVDLTRIVTWIYLILAALACTVVCIFPFYRNFMRFVLMVSRGITMSESIEFMSSIQGWRKHLPSGSAFVTSLVLVTIWYIYRTSDWAWVIQDFMGVCVCLLCLETILIPNLKVATALLSLAFLYDVFFVFISPYIFDSSVMESVATGSSDSNSDPNYCEKYPDDETYCADNSLPMLLQVPTLFTYLDGNSILGLGDVVLPGLLAVWAARHDIRQFGKLDFDQFTRGFFPLAVKMYCVGLLLADVAVMVFETGQPALLYIVPCVLGSILYRSFHNDSLAQLWNDLPTMKLVALPIHSDEQDSLLSNTNVVVAEAIWNKTREHDFITVLDHTHIAPIPVTATNNALANYQNSILNSGNGDVPSKFVRTKKEKRHKGGHKGSGSSSSAVDAHTTIVDNNTSQSAAEESHSSGHLGGGHNSSSSGSSSSGGGGVVRDFESDDNVPI